MDTGWAQALGNPATYQTRVSEFKPECQCFLNLLLDLPLALLVVE